MASTSSTSLKTASWNVAAVNNNPFEYYITYPGEEYMKMMSAVEAFVNSPGDGDILVEELFTDAMYAELSALSEAQGWGGVAETAAEFEVFKKRTIISGFLKDSKIGKKRLTSMPDRATNTVATSSGPAFRPTVINCYGESMDSVEDWWAKWKAFMFETKFEVSGGAKTGAELLQPIKSSKYPALTAEEEKISLPLQTLCMAIFDAVELHLVQTVAPKDWQRLRAEIADALNKKKDERTREIIAGDAFEAVEMWFLQEVQLSFVERAEANAVLGARYAVVAPAKKSRANQNSVALVSKERFDVSTIEEVTALAEPHLVEAGGKGKSPISDGDLLLFKVKDKQCEETFLFCSFHGDTNGLATVPVVTAVANTHKQLEADSGEKLTLVYGIDANTYANDSPAYKAKDQQGVVEFGKAVVGLGLTTAGGDNPDQAFITCICARTFLQPQLSKAARRDEILEKGDLNPKDHFIFHKERFPATQPPKRDNTGTGAWDASIELIPTIQFPSDHCIVTAELVHTPATDRCAAM